MTHAYFLYYSYGLTETTAGCVYQKLGVSPSGSTGVLVANMECKLVDEEGNGKIWLIVKCTASHSIIRVRPRSTRRDSFEGSSHYEGLFE